MSEHLGQLVQGQRRNAALSWVLVGLIAAAVAISLVRGDLLWVGFAVVVAGLATLPPLALGNARAMLPWEVTLLSALPVLGRAFSTVPITGQVATYFAVAAIALIIVVELHLFTPVRMNDGFAVGVVVVATLATAGVWAVVRWGSDRLLGTDFLRLSTLGEHAVEQRLMWEFVASTGAGVLAGLVFAFYVRRRIRPDVRLPEEVPR